MSATVIPFPAGPSITPEELELYAAVLQQASQALDEIAAELSPDADPELSDQLLDHADLLVDLAHDPDASEEELEQAIDEHERLSLASSEKITRSAVRRTAGDETLAQVERAVVFASAMAVTSQIAFASFEHEGRRVVEGPLDRAMLRRFLRAVGDGFSWGDANLDDVDALWPYLLDALQLAALDGPPDATTMRDAMHRLFCDWADVELIATGDCRIARDRKVSGRGEDRAARLEAFEVGVAASIATRLVPTSDALAAARVRTSTDPHEWLELLESTWP